MKTVKMLSLMGLIATAFTGTAKADGFVCETADGSMTMKIYNHTNPERGTRNGAVMVLSDPSINYGRKTIARFTEVAGTLSNHGAYYVAKVDLRFNDSKRKGELIMGTKLGQLDAVIANLQFSYGRPVRDGAQVDGSVTLVKRNGDEISADLNCVRYLKGE